MTPVAFSEIDPFPSAVLAHHYPNVPNLGDISNYERWHINGTIDLLVGGSPCQAFSIAGLRKGFDDDRGNLTLTYLRVIGKVKPRWVVWENVPGVLSHDDGRTFGTFIRALDELGYGYAWRVLDAQYFGVPQRRRRIFLVAYLGDWRPPASVLFESTGLCGDTESIRETQQGTTTDTTCGTGTASIGFRKVSHGEYVIDETVSPVLARDYKDHTDLIMQGAAVTEHTVTDKTMSITASYGQGGADLATKPLIMQGYTASSYGGYRDGVGTLRANGGDLGGGSETIVVHGTQDPCVGDKAFALGRNSGMENAVVEVTGTLTCGHGSRGVCFDSIASGICALHGPLPIPRKLTPMECERLQGFPDNYTNVEFKGKPGANIHRYKALGNSMAVPVMRWIGQRIVAVDQRLGDV